MKFLRNLLATIIGVFISVFLILIFFVAVAGAIGDDKKIVVFSNSVLELHLDAMIKDYAPKDIDPLTVILDLEDEKMGLNTIINAIENAKTDNKIKGISIVSKYINAGIAQTEAIRNKLIEFKESGKFVLAYADFYDQKNYYLSSVADSIFLNPVGAIDFGGLRSEVLYFKDFEDKYGVKYEVIRHGKYKSAMEPFLANKMSDANREQITSFLNSIWEEILDDIALSRNKTNEELNKIADDLLARNPELALKNGMLDGVIYKDQYRDKLAKHVGIEKFKKISLQDYIDSGKGRIIKTTPNKIAVIYAQGDIKYGKGDENYIGQELIINALKKARKNKSVKAIVLRVNSPGGSALASDLIWRELELTKKEKPLVVSMGNVAASGGYYIACNADKIIAEPTSITGSIGVFGALPNVNEFASKIGINAEQVATNKSASYSVFEPISDEFYEVTKEGVENIYNTFVKRVAAGRNMTFSEVDSIAQGRVWTGKEALQIGLVDQLGSLDDAIEEAALLADVSDYKVRNYPSYKKDFKDAFKRVPFMNSKAKVLREALGDENYRMYKSIQDFSKIKGIQTRMPFVLEIK